MKKNKIPFCARCGNMLVNFKVVEEEGSLFAKCKCNHLNPLDPLNPYIGIKYQIKQERD